MDTGIEVMLNNNRPGLFVCDKRREMILQIFQERTRKYDILANEPGLVLFLSVLTESFPAGRGY